MTEVIPVGIPVAPRPHRSVSQYSTYAKCSEQYRLEKVAGAPGLPAAWFHQGTAVHFAIEEWENSGRSMSDAEASAIGLEEYERQHNLALEKQPNVELWLTGGRVRPADDIETRRARVPLQIQGYIDHARASEWRVLQIGTDTYATEYPFEIELAGVPVRGYIDQIIEHGPTGRLMVRDIKTGSKLPASVLQLVVYDFAVEDEFDIRPGWGDFYMAKNHSPTNPYNLTFFTRDMVSDMFARMDEGVRRGVFLPNPGDACRTCGVKEFCREVGTNSTYSEVFA